jgi:hypothetical protein
LTVSLAISAVAIGIHRGDLAWNMRNAQAVWLEWLGPVVNLPRAWPSFFWRLDPAVLRSEWPFVIHAAMWVAVFVAGNITGKVFSKGARANPIAFLLAGLMVAAQAGWWLNGDNGLDAAPSQLQVLSTGRPVLEISPFGVHRIASVTGRLSIATKDVGRTDAPPPWLMLESVPAGTYEARVETSRPRAGELLVFAGRSSLPIQRFRVRPENRQTFTIALPAGAMGLTIVPDPDLEKVTGRVELTPVHLLGSGRLARLGRPYGSATVFFLDDHAFVEEDGFWIRGGQAAELSLGREPRRANAVFTLVVQNGRAPNVVTIEHGGIERRETLAPSETRSIDLTGDADGTLPLAISSASGFRPSDDGVSQDSRFLGVRVRVN